MSRATTVDVIDEIFEQLARSGEIPPYLADLTSAASEADHRGSTVTEPAATEAGSTPSASTNWPR